MLFRNFLISELSGINFNEFFRSSHPKVFCKKGVFRNSAIFFLKRVSGTGVFQWILRILQTTSGECFWLFLFQCYIINNRHAQCLDLFFAKELLLYRTITLTVHEAGMTIIFDNCFLWLALTVHRPTAVKRGHPCFYLYHFYPHTNIQKLICIFTSEILPQLLIAAHAIITHAFNR